MRLFRSRTFCLSCVILFITGVVMFTAITYLPTFLQVANGATASNSGLLLVPLFFGVFGSSIVAGQVISRTGHWRPFPIAGTGIATIGMYLLSTLDTHSSRFQSGLDMAVVGVGIGMVMQVLVLATQNEAPVEDLGSATSTVSFARAVGGSVGVALFGALFGSRLTELLGKAADLDVTPEMIRKLPHGQRILTAEAFSDAITRVFLFAVPLLLLAFVLTWFLKETPLRTASGQARRAVAFDMEFAEESLGAYGDPALAYDDVQAQHGLPPHWSCTVTVSLRERKKAETRDCARVFRLAACRRARARPRDRGRDRRGRGRVIAYVLQLLRVEGRCDPRQHVGEHLAARRAPRREAGRRVAAGGVASGDAPQHRPSAVGSRRVDRRGNRLVRGHPSLAVRYAARLADLEREVVLEIARRTGLDADRDPYPRSLPARPWPVPGWR